MKKTKALGINLLIRQVCKFFQINMIKCIINISAASSKRKKEDINFYTQYKIDKDTDLPCGMKPAEIQDRFATVCAFRKKHPAQSSTFNTYKISNRQEILDSKIFESNDRSDRVSIFTAMHANEERFLCHNPKSNGPRKLQPMHLVSKNMEYASTYAEDKNDFEKVTSTNEYSIPNWFSRFYV
jgi:hypothetical protein